MIKKFAATILVILSLLAILASIAFGQGGGPPVRVTESDGSPSANPVRRINFPNGSLSCTGSTCTYSGGTAGSVSNPSVTSTDNAAARFDGAGGVTIQNSVLIIGDDGTLTTGGGASAAEFRLLEPSGSGSNYTGFKAPALGGNVVYTLPTADGTSGYALTTNGSAALSWSAISGLYPITPIVSGDFSWFNQGGATLEASNGHVAIIAPDSTGDNLRIREKTIPSSPYTVTVAFNLLVRAEDFSSAGIVLRDSTGGGLVTLRLEFGAVPDLDVSKWNSATSYNSVYAGTTYSLNPLGASLLYLRVADDGTNRICSFSYDGVNFIQLHSVSRTDFITPDRIGFYVGVNAVTNGAIATFYSWTQS